MQFDIYQDAAKAERGLASYSFKIDGQESLYWCPTRHAVERVVNRLRLGRSGEAFGGAGLVTPGAVTALSKGHDKPPRAKVVSAGEVVTETVKMKSGKEKVREKRPGFIFELDGLAREDLKFASEQGARGAAAVSAFLSRGKLGRFAEAEAQFKDQHGFECKVQVIDLPGTALHRKVAAKDARGGLWHVGFNAGPAGDRIKFVQVVPAAPK